MLTRYEPDNHVKVPEIPTIAVRRDNPNPQSALGLTRNFDYVPITNFTVEVAYLEGSKSAANL